MSLTLLGAVFTAITLLVAGHSKAVGRVIAGGFLFLLGYASVVPDLPSLTVLPPSFLAVSAGFIWLGLAFVARGVVEAAREREKLLIASLGAGVIPALVILSIAALLPLIYTAKAALLLASWRGVIAAVGLGGAGVFVVTLFSIAKVGRAWKWLDDKWLTRFGHPSPSIQEGRTWEKIGAVVLAGAAAVIWKHFGAATVCIIGSVTILHDLLRPTGKVPRWGLQPFIVIFALGVSTWFIWTVAGRDISLTVTGLQEAPFSAAAEMALAPMLALAAWALLGLWPLHGAGPGSVFSLLGGVILIRWGMGVIPEGMEHIAPLAGIVAVVAALHATSVRRAGEYAAALGVLAVVPSGAGAWPFFVLGSVPATLWILEKKTLIPGFDRHQVVGALLLPALAYALPTMLRGETFLTVIAVLAGATMFAVPKD